MRVLGCLLVLPILAVLAGEVWFYLWLSHRLNDQYLGVGILVAVMSYVGVRLVKYHGSRLPLELMAGAPGKRMVGMVGALLVAFPGLCTGVVGLLLQIPPLQSLFAKPAGKLAMSLARQAMKRMGGAGGGNPFAAGGMFPGMQPRVRPDDRADYGGTKPGKTYDTTTEP